MVGAGKIIAVDVNPQKLAWAEEFGATHAVDASKEDPVARVHAISGMGGVDFAFEVVGTQKTVEQALASTHRGGMCVVVGVCPSGTRISVDPDDAAAAARPHGHVVRRRPPAQGRAALLSTCT